MQPSLSPGLEPAHEDDFRRLENLLALLPKGRATALEIGARHGFITRKLVDYFAEVTALDLRTPSFRMERVTPVAGDVQKLTFPDNAFDCVICTEVLEHVPDVSSAAREIQRVARHEVLIGVPYRQDTRVGRTTCSQCGRVNPPFGHVNTFDEAGLLRLFGGMTLISRETVGSTREGTNALSAWLMDKAGNPYGYYNQEEPCIHCGSRMVPPAAGSLTRRLCGAVGVRLYEMQCRLNRPQPTWIHLLFRKG